MMNVPVSLGSRSYDITFGGLSGIGTLLDTFQPISRAVIVTDVNVQSFGYDRQVVNALKALPMETSVVSVSSGEQSKCITVVNTLWESMLAAGADRKSVLVAVGGGVVGDLGGFAAATFARGIRFFQVPTTLLAQVDSSVGGKVGIDLPQAKNMVGSFHQPLGVCIDIETLQTLPEEQYLSGLGEVVKYGESLDAELFGYLENNVDAIHRRDSAVLQKIVADCCRIKAGVVAEDEFETAGKRILLNYGHTFAHSFETLSGYSLLHGLAVSIGSICAAKTAYKLGLIDSPLLSRFVRLHQALHLPTEVPAGIAMDEAYRLMQNDKKTEFGVVRFVVPTGLGQCKVIPLSPNQFLYDYKHFK